MWKLIAPLFGQLLKLVPLLGAWLAGRNQVKRQWAEHAARVREQQLAIANNAPRTPDSAAQRIRERGA